MFVLFDDTGLGCLFEPVPLQTTLPGLLQGFGLVSIVYFVYLCTMEIHKL